MAADSSSQCGAPPANYIQHRHVFEEKLREHVLAMNLPFEDLFLRFTEHKSSPNDEYQVSHLKEPDEDHEEFFIRLPAVGNEIEHGSDYCHDEIEVPSEASSASQTAHGLDPASNPKDYEDSEASLLDSEIDGPGEEYGFNFAELGLYPSPGRLSKRSLAFTADEKMDLKLRFQDQIPDKREEIKNNAATHNSQNFHYVESIIKQYLTAPPPKAKKAPKPWQRPHQKRDHVDGAIRTHDVQQRLSRLRNSSTADGRPVHRLSRDPSFSPAPEFQTTSF